MKIGVFRTTLAILTIIILVLIIVLGLYSRECAHDTKKDSELL
jgi:preprotein translocase subunit SecG